MNEENRRVLSPQSIEQVSQSVSSVHAARLGKLKGWVEEKAHYPYKLTKFERSHEAGPLQDKYAAIESGDHTGDTVSVAGRITAIRNNGMFIVMQDPTGHIQIFHNIKEVAEEVKADLKRLDLGDIIGVTGKVRRTPRGELTIDGESFILLAKSLDPLPEKYHGMTDPEIRVRQRHKDLSSNDTVRARLRARSRIIRAIRDEMERRDFIEVETPSLHAIAGGAEARPFVTHHNALDTDFFLRIAPELFLKRLVAGGLSDRVFEIGKNFRNEGISPTHNPEFTTIEAYQAYANYEDMMDLVEALILAAARSVLAEGQTAVQYGDHEIELKTPWPRRSMADLVKEHTGVDFLSISDAGAARAEAEKLGVELAPGTIWGKVLEEVFSEKVEHKLIQPIHVTGIPADISPLAKQDPDNPMIAERFESYMTGKELANAFSELNDPFTQYRFFAAQAARRAAGDEEATLPDDDYIKVLEFGLPPTGGLGIGIDRLVMLLTDARHIRDVICFPATRPEGESQAEPSVSSVAFRAEK